ncbi:MAG: hypothetical protein MHM6MM_000112 [Cercozoa sp. M6MM]
MNTDQELQVLRLLIVVTGGISLVATLGVCLTYALLYKRVSRSFSVRLVLALACSDMLAALSLFLDDDFAFGKPDDIPDTSDAACIVQAMARQMFSLSSVMWVLCISVVLLLISLKKGRVLWKFEPLMHLLCWGVPLLTVIALAALGHFGRTSLWCWVPRKYQASRLVFLHVPTFVTMVLVLLVLTIVSRRHDRRLVHYSLRASQSRLALFAWCFVLLRIPAVLDRVTDLIYPHDDLFFFSFLHALFSPLAGAVNAVLFLTDANVRRAWREKYRPMRPHDALLHDTDDDNSPDHQYAVKGSSIEHVLSDDAPVEMNASVTVMCLTWNVNKVRVSARLLHRLVHRKINDNKVQLLALAMQEFDSANREKLRDLSDGLCDLLGGTDWTTVTVVPRGSLAMLLVAKRGLCIDAVRTDSEATGVGNIWHNKGAVAAAIWLDETLDLAFVGAHLAAHEKEQFFRKRQKDIALIFQSCNKLRPSFARQAIGADDSSITSGDEESRELLRSSKASFDFASGDDAVHTAAFSLEHTPNATFFFGDLNFRLNARDTLVATDRSLESNELESRDLSQHSACTTVAEIESHVRDCHYDLLAREYDQLNAARRSNELLTRFKEPQDIDFVPSYKYKPQRQEAAQALEAPERETESERSEWLETTRFSQKRLPSFCDRVLFACRLSALHRCTPLEYFSLPQREALVSDHIPVGGILRFDYNTSVFHDRCVTRIELRNVAVSFAGSDAPRNFFDRSTQWRFDELMEPALFVTAGTDSRAFADEGRLSRQLLNHESVFAWSNTVTLRPQCTLRELLLRGIAVTLSDSSLEEFDDLFGETVLPVTLTSVDATGASVPCVSAPLTLASRVVGQVTYSVRVTTANVAGTLDD